LLCAAVVGCVHTQTPPPVPPPQTLSCATVGRVAVLTLEMDHSSYMPGSHYFTPRNARLNDNYHSAPLTCVGATLTDGIRCVGYDNGASTIVIEAIVSHAKDGLLNGVPTVATASYRFLRYFDGKPAPPQTPGPWPCTISPAAAPAPPPALPTQSMLRCAATAGVASIRMAIAGRGRFLDTNFMDNYHSSQNLSCVGFALSDPVHCLGYDNGGPGLIEAIISPATDETISPLDPEPTAVRNTASYKFLRTFDGEPAPPQTPGPWPCSITDSGDDGGGGGGH
jgi:hypothetical protein